MILSLIGDTFTVTVIFPISTGVVVNSKNIGIFDNIDTAKATKVYW